MSRTKLDTVNEFARRGYNLRIACEVCGRVIEASSILMMQELHQRRASMEIAKLEERARYRECGHKGATITACEATF